MADALVIVESPAKAKTIRQIFRQQVYRKSFDGAYSRFAKESNRR